MMGKKQEKQDSWDLGKSRDLLTRKNDKNDETILTIRKRVVKYRFYR